MSEVIAVKLVLSMASLRVPDSVPEARQGSEIEAERQRTVPQRPGLERKTLPLPKAHEFKAGGGLSRRFSLTPILSPIAEPGTSVTHEDANGIYTVNFTLPISPRECQFLVLHWVGSNRVVDPVIGAMDIRSQGVGR